MLVSVFFYTYIIHLLIDALFLVREMLMKPFNFYVERISTCFLMVLCIFYNVRKEKIKWADFACLYASSFGVKYFNKVTKIKAHSRNPPLMKCWQ